MVRQATAIHLCTYAGILYSEGKNKQAIFWIISSVFMHLASLFMFSLFLVKYVKKLNNKHLKILLICSTIGMFVMSSSIFSIISNYLPIQYQLHLEKESDFGIMTIITKVIFIPLFWMSCNLKLYKFSNLNRTLFYLGFIGFCLKLALLKLPVVNRLADYYILLSIFPIYFLLQHLYIKRKKILFFGICIFLLSFYGAKTVLFPVREYLYDSIYF